jgi:hypothetical protein
MTNAIKVLLQMQSGFLQLESTLESESTDKCQLTKIVSIIKSHPVVI